MQPVEIAIIIEAYILAGCFYMLTCDNISSFAKAIIFIIIASTLIVMVSVIFNYINAPLIQNRL